MYLSVAILSTKSPLNAQATVNVVFSLPIRCHIASFVYMLCPAFHTCGADSTLNGKPRV